jgi:hypothetical protein
MELNEMQYITTPDGAETIVQNNNKLHKFKQWFREAVESGVEWRKEAREDRDFYIGHQWKDEDKQALEKNSRPAVTVNRIKPLMNVLSGYQRLNRYDIDFLPRTNDDMDNAQVRKGITKYIMDKTNYNYEESDVFNDGIQMGIGWFEVGYKFDWEVADGEAFIRRVSPFDIYTDPESRDKYFRDMKYVIRARWVDKEELANKYPEHYDEIIAQSRYHMSEEAENEGDNSKLWYRKDINKIRFAECWYKKPSKKQIFVLANGEVVEKVAPEMLLMGQIRERRVVDVTEVRLMAFFDNVVLEDVESPYHHQEYPFVPFVCYYQGDDDIPSGIIRDLKDPQREINKRRSQELHILNTSSNSGWIYEKGAMTGEQANKFKHNATKAGAMLEVGAGALTAGKMRELQPASVPTGVVNATQEAVNDLPSISGINEALMGTDISNLQSGRAIELKQKQAITHIASLFDNLRFTKERIAYLLWGKRGAQGIVPQFYTTEKTFRIIGQNGGFEFVTINQQVTQVDERTQQVIRRTLNDLSVGEYDIVVADTPATATQRTAQFWSLVDACGKLGIQGNMVLDILLDLSDIPQKEEIKQRMQQQQQQQAQAQQQQMQMQIELEREKKLSRSIAYKDLQLPLQLQLASKAGIFPNEYADAFMEWSMQQYAMQLGITGGVPQPAQPMMPVIPQQPVVNNQQPLTQSAMNGLIGADKPVL